MCPFNGKFAHVLTEPAFSPREVLAGKDARTLARDILQMTQEEFSAAFEGSPMKRATLRGSKRKAAVVLGNAGTADDVALLDCVRDEEPDDMVREHAAWALTALAAAARRRR